MWQRYNGTTKIFEKSTNDGASWSALDVSAAILLSGNLAVARMPVSGAWVLTGDLTVSAAKFIVDSSNAFGLQFGTVARLRWQAASTRVELVDAAAAGFVALAVERLSTNGSIHTSSAAGDIIIPNAKALRGVNAAGTDTLPLLGVNASNSTVLYCNGSSLVIEGFASQATAGALTGYILIQKAGTNYKIPYYAF